MLHAEIPDAVAERPAIRSIAVEVDRSISFGHDQAQEMARRRPCRRRGGCGMYRVGHATYHGDIDHGYHDSAALR
jgi:hypothetical protein